MLLLQKLACLDDLVELNFGCIRLFVPVHRFDVFVSVAKEFGCRNYRVIELIGRILLRSSHDNDLLFVDLISFCLFHNLAEVNRFFFVAKVSWRLAVI